VKADFKYSLTASEQAYSLSAEDVLNMVAFFSVFSDNNIQKNFSVRILLCGKKRCADWSDFTHWQRNIGAYFSR